MGISEVRRVIKKAKTLYLTKKGFSFFVGEDWVEVPFPVDINDLIFELDPLLVDLVEDGIAEAEIRKIGTETNYVPAPDFESELQEIFEISKSDYAYLEKATDKKSTRFHNFLVTKDGVFTTDGRRMHHVKKVLDVSSPVVFKPSNLIKSDVIVDVHKNHVVQKTSGFSVFSKFSSVTMPDCQTVLKSLLKLDIGTVELIKEDVQNLKVLKKIAVKDKGVVSFAFFQDKLKVGLMNNLKVVQLQASAERDASYFLNIAYFLDALTVEQPLNFAASLDHRGVISNYSPLLMSYGGRISVLMPSAYE